MPPAPLGYAMHERRQVHGVGLNGPASINLPTPILAAIVGGVFVLLSAISALLFFCSWKKNSKRRQRLSTQLEARGSASRVDSDFERQSAASEISGRTRTRPCMASASVTPLPTFEFSPPSPHWRPVLPSYASVERQRNRYSPGRGRTGPRSTRSGTRSSTHPSPASATQAFRPSASRVTPPANRNPHEGIQAPRSPSSAAGQRTIKEVPRIEVHPARDSQSPGSKSPSQRSRRMKPSAIETRSQTNSRPLSGLGITTIDFTSRSLLSTQHIHRHPSSPELANSKSSPSVPRANLSPQLNSSHSLTAPIRNSTTSSIEDVRLAYTISASSIGSTSSNIIAPAKRDALSASSKNMTSSKEGNRVSAHATEKSISGSVDRRDSSHQVIQRDPSKEKAYSSKTFTVKEDVGSDTSRRRNDYGRVTATIENPCIASTQTDAAQTPSKSLSSKRSNLSKRLGLAADAIDDSTKSELYALRSLGSASFDSLIAYLEDTVEPGVDASSSGIKLKDALSSKASASFQTRVDTTRLDEGSFQKWIGGLTTSASLLQLTGIEIRNESGEARNAKERRSRSKSLSRARPKDGHYPDGQTSAKSNDKTGSTNKDSKSSRLKHPAVTEKCEANIVSRGKDSIKKNALKSKEPDYALANPISSSSASSSMPDHLIRPLSLTKTPLLRGRKDSEDFISALPSFAIPSSATKLFSSFPSDESALSRGKSSGSGEAQQQSSGKDLVAASSMHCNTMSPRTRSTALAELISSALPPSSSQRLSVGSTSSSNSSVGSLTQRHDWGRESLTPRFNHLRAVLEGHYEEPPPLPKRETRHNEGKAKRALGSPSIPETPGARGEPGSTPLMLFNTYSSMTDPHVCIERSEAHAGRILLERSRPLH